MAQEEVNHILEGLKLGLAVRQQRQELAQQQQRIEIQKKQQESEEKHREAENKRYIDSLAEQKRQFDITSKAAQALHNVQIMQAEQSMTQNAMQGIPIAGDQVSGATPPVVPQGMTQVPEGHQLHNLPTGHSVVLPTPEKFAELLAARARITNAPAEEAKTREQAALQKAETERQLTVSKQAQEAKLVELNKENEYKMQQQAQAIKAQQAIHSSEQAMHLRVALLQATNGMSEPSFMKSMGVNVTTDAQGQPTINSQDPTNYVMNTIKQLRDGQMSADELKKRDPKLAPVIERMASTMGVGALTKDEIGQLRDLEIVAQVAPVLREMNLIRANANVKVLVKGTDAYARFQTLEDQVGKAQPALARIFSGTKRFNNVEMEKYWNALVPRKSPLTSDKESGFSKYNDFVTKDIQDAFNTITSSLPEGQRAIIRDRIGINRLPYLSSAIKTPGAEPTTPVGAAPALGSFGGKITVKRKSDGVVGTIDLKDFNTQMYKKQ